MSLSRRGFLLTSASAGALRLAADLPFLRVGWVGNDSWASEMRDRIKRSCAASPLIESVAADGFLVPLAGFDAYVIADWDVLRGPLPMRLVTSRKPVYFRPGAMECLGDAPELIRTASANGTYLHFALPHRNDSMYRQARDWVRSGVIGPIERAESWWNTSGDSPIAASALRECLALRMDALRFLLDTEAPADWAASTSCYHRVDGAAGDLDTAVVSYAGPGECHSTITVAPGVQRRGFGELVFGRAGLIAILNGEETTLELDEKGSHRTIGHASRADVTSYPFGMEDFRIFLECVAGLRQPQPHTVAAEAAVWVSQMGYPPAPVSLLGA